MITFSMSYLLTYVVRRSVSYSMINSFSYLNTVSYINGIYALINTGSYFQYYCPYIIQILSTVYEKTFIPFPFLKSNRLTKEQLFAIICGSTLIFFLILAVIILVINKKNEVKFLYDDYTISSSSEIELIQEIKENEEIKRIDARSYSDEYDIDFWM